MTRSRVLMLAMACALATVIAPAARGAGSTARRAPVFHPRVGGALGLIPAFARNGQPRPADVGSGSLTPAVYHAGSVMAGGVTVHTVFWAPSGYAFSGAPPGAAGDYKSMIRQFFADLAHDSGAAGTCTATECNALTVLPQFAEGTAVGAITPGSNSIQYSAGSDSIDDTDPYPAPSSQCASPSGIATCLTDGQISAEVDHVVQSTGGTPRGLGNLWFVFLPPSVDECITPSVCGTNSFAGYHSVSNVSGHGATIYAVAIDPIIEVPVPQGSDPEGFPDAEAAINVAAHETVEAMTDPLGAGWMDPNGGEVGDKCETQIGSPLGFAANGSPYNQVINSHQYLFQEMWANVGDSGNPGCVQATSNTSNQLPLPQVNLRQFNSVVTGNVNRAAGGGIRVTVTLLRSDASGLPVTVAKASTTTASNGSWSVSLAPHAPGDDRDEVDVDYSGTGAPSPVHQVIDTGNGGNAFNEAGWIGWFAMDTGSAATSSSLTLAPCFQTGQLSAFFNSAPLPAPTNFCNTQTDSAAVPTPAAGKGDRLTVTSNDNRAFQDPSTTTPNLQGGLVSLTAPVGEPGSVFCVPGSNPCTPPFSTPLSFFTAGGFPSCTADLEVREVGCLGLVPGARYTLSTAGKSVSGTADASGAVIEPLAARRGAVVTLSNGSRTLTALHVANLRVDIGGQAATVLDGRCQPGDYWGAPLSTPPISIKAGAPSSATGGGTALTGTICPINGDASGLPTALLSQTDELSGGQTETEVPGVVDTSPIDGETLYGKFTALAESGLLLSDNTVLPTDRISRISLEILTSSGSAVFRARNVDTSRGVNVTGLVPGSYLALWTLTDQNGDTRIVGTRFTEQLASGPKATVSCRLTGARRRQVTCAISFPQLPAPNGTVRVRITRDGTVVALGHGRVSGGRARVTMRRLNVVRRGTWKITLVLSQPHKRPETVNLSPRRVL